MGTLTADQPRLAEYCDHKLPTSCRLSSIPECCACADERAHAASYSTYIDGIGFVPRGNRWQRYCWFCKEFWENRVAASGLRPGQTRIPEVPDQKEFLERWYEFHQGYRTIRKDDGTEERVAVLGEELREVSPGYLPRTLEELRAGRERSEMEEQMRIQAQVAVQEEQQPETSIEDTLDQLFQAASTEDVPAPVQQHAAPTNIHAQAMTAAGTRNREYQARRIAALRRELFRMRNGIERVISGLRELGENVPDATEATGRLADLGRTLDDISGAPSTEQADLAIRSVRNLTETAGASQTDRATANMQARVDEARDHMNDARRMRDQAASELDVAEQEFRTSQRRVQQLQREQRTAENYMRIFGTREEMAAQGENYESPIGGMFSRAYERFRAAEEVRQEVRTLRQVLEDEEANGGEDNARRLGELEDNANRLMELQRRRQDVWGVPRPPPRLVQDSTGNTTHLMEEARDEVFAGQNLAAMVGAVQPNETDASRTSSQRSDTWASDEPQVAELDATAPGQREAGDSALEEYYDMLRRQGWSQHGSNATRQRSANFSQSMLESIVSAREQELQNRNETLREIADGYRESVGLQARTPTNDNMALHEPYSATPEERRQDFIFLLASLCSPLASIDGLGFERHHIDAAATVCDDDPEDPQWMERLSHALNGTDPVSLLHNDDLVWSNPLAFCLPGDRLRRIRRAGYRVGFSNQPQSDDLEVRRGNIEVMAEAYTMSAELRRKSGLTAPEQLRMLYRLQQGRRPAEDRAILISMLLQQDAVDLAARVHRDHAGEMDAEQRRRIEATNFARQESARDGNHSRLELDAQRRATTAFAAAAGRLAMQTGPQALINRSTTTSRRLHPTAADYRAMGLGSSEDSESEPDDDEPAGLDAPDTGRPVEAKTDEEMTFKLECRICYSQTADIACLPCGHLVMCKWCSDQHSPTLGHDRTRPKRASQCPVCRKGIRQKVRVFRA